MTMGGSGGAFAGPATMVIALVCGSCAFPCHTEASQVAFRACFLSAALEGHVVRIVHFCGIAEGGGFALGGISCMPDLAQLAR